MTVVLDVCCGLVRCCSCIVLLLQFGRPDIATDTVAEWLSFSLSSLYVVGSSPPGRSNRVQAGSRNSKQHALVLQRVLHTVFTAHGWQYGAVKLLQAVHGTTRLAQLVERWPFKPVVVGSSPTGGVTLFPLVRCHAR